MTIEDMDDAAVELVWDPPWNQSMISEEGKMKLGMSLARVATGIEDLHEAVWRLEVVVCVPWSCPGRRCGCPSGRVRGRRIAAGCPSGR